MNKLWIVLFVIILGGCGNQQSSSSSTAIPQVQSDKIGLGLVGNSQTSPAEEPGQVQVVWGSNYTTPASVFNMRNQLVLGFDKPYDGTLNDLSWWQANHPTWIEYLCDRTPVTPISPYVGIALDITNPDVRAYLFSTAALPALNDGYPAVSVDNVILYNYAGFCGHYDAQGKFIRQFDGVIGGIDNSWTTALTAYITDLRDRIHAAGGVFALNYASRLPQQQSSEFAVIDTADMIFYESGFTNSSAGGIYRPGVKAENSIIENALAAQADGKCYFSMNKVAIGYPDTNVDDLTWIIANYLLIKGSCTYLWIGARAQYGQINHYAAYDTDYGSPLDEAIHLPDGTWIRHYTKATVTVNPHGTAVITTLS